MKSRFGRVALLSLFISACSPIRYLPPAPDPNMKLAPLFDLEGSPAFEKALKVRTGTPAREKARIDYLLEVIGHSPYNFIRNGSRYTGKRAKAHFKWKYFRNRWQVKTAEAFMDRVSATSKVTGQPYLVELGPERFYPLQPLLLRELKRFDEKLDSQQMSEKKQPLA